MLNNFFIFFLPTAEYIFIFAVATRPSRPLTMRREAGETRLSRCVHYDNLASLCDDRSLISTVPLHVLSLSANGSGTIVGCLWFLGCYKSPGKANDGSVVRGESMHADRRVTITRDNLPLEISEIYIWELALSHTFGPNRPTRRGSSAFCRVIYSCLPCSLC